MRFGGSDNSGTTVVVVTGQSSSSFALRVFLKSIDGVALLGVVCGIVSIVSVIVGVGMLRVFEVGVVVVVGIGLSLAVRIGDNTDDFFDCIPDNETHRAGVSWMWCSLQLQRSLVTLRWRRPHWQRCHCGGTGLLWTRAFEFDPRLVGQVIVDCVVVITPFGDTTRYGFWFAPYGIIVVVSTWACSCSVTGFVLTINLSADLEDDFVFVVIVASVGDGTFDRGLGWSEHTHWSCS